MVGDASHWDPPSDPTPESLDYWSGAVRSRIASMDEITPSSPLDTVSRALKTIEDELSAMRLSMCILRERHNSLVGISRLPPEVLGHIFSECARLERWGWINVTHVCRRWRAIALDMHHLWSHITFTVTPRGWIGEMFARAHLVPLVLDIGYKLEVLTTQDVELIAKHLPQVKFLRFAAYQDTSQPILESLSRPTPLLQSLEVSSDHPIRGAGFDLPRVFLPAAPQLRHLSITKAASVPWKSLAMRSLVSLIVLDTRPLSPNPTPLQDVLDVLDTIPTLQTLVLDRGLSGDAFAPIVTPGHIVRLPNLLRMDYGGEIDDCLLFLEHVRAPTSASLCLTCTVIESTPSLERLAGAVSSYLRGGETQMIGPMHRLVIEFTHFGTIDVSVWRSSAGIFRETGTITTPSMQYGEQDIRLTFRGDCTAAWSALAWTDLFCGTFAVEELRVLHLVGCSTHLPLPTTQPLAAFLSMATGVNDAYANDDYAVILLPLLLPTSPPIGTSDDEDSSIESKGQVLFPGLQTLTIWRLDLRWPMAGREEESTFEFLLTVLKARSAAGHPITKLDLRSSPYYDSREELKLLVPNIVWDFEEDDAGSSE